MPHLALLITVPLNELQVAVLAARALDLGLLDEHVATTLPARSDGPNASTTPELPQHAPSSRTRNTPKTQPQPQTPGQLPSVNRGKRGLAGEAARLADDPLRHSRQPAVRGTEGGV